ncbi:hypothetical protein [Deinococcus arenicola]|uniref:Uncharacterized protein n=1 Tax=Deinococcus arenicola TaxID=2994950 RepID=A0ABU4DV80_9DEIO|nr:hypothetical protein [Deinococcus sp. ZS9-10]MDV6376351.1 hypothetical protein [Deinococcus sp. ZS9-10]
MTLWASIVRIMPGGRAALSEYLLRGGKMVTLHQYTPQTLSQLFGDALPVIQDSWFTVPAAAPAAPGGLGLKSKYNK